MSRLRRPKQGVKLLGLLLAGSPGQHMAGCSGWPDTYWLPRDEGGLVAAIMSFA
jgi:hypothetical protein